MTLQRANDLAERGANCAKLAKSKGKNIKDWRGYCPIMGDNNAEAWKSGWDEEWEKINV